MGEAIAVEVEVVADSSGKSRSLLRGSHGEELGDLETRLTASASVGAKDGVGCNGKNLINGMLQEQSIGGLRREWVRINGVVLKQST